MALGVAQSAQAPAVDPYAERGLIFI